MDRLTADEVALLDRYWKAANYLTVGQICLQANPLLREPLRPERAKPRLLGHWGTSPGLSFVYVHLNRLIRRIGANVLYIAGPGRRAARIDPPAREAPQGPLHEPPPRTFRLFCPDETNSNRLGNVFEVENRCFMGALLPGDDHVSHEGRVIEVLSEHNCQGWLEGYLLTGRHGLFATYEAFAMVVASMATQHAKWLDASEELPWRAQVPSLNHLLTSTCWRNDHNGFSHQGPGFIDTILSKKGTIARICFPPDANSLLAVSDHCLRSRNYVNLIVIDKQPQLQWLTIEEARAHFVAGASIWAWAGNGDDGEPDVVLASAGDIVTMETVAAAEWLRKKAPWLRVRVVNVIDLMNLFTPDAHPHGMTTAAIEALFTRDTDVVFAFHGYPRAIHELVHGRPDAGRFHVRGDAPETSGVRGGAPRGHAGGARLDVRPLTVSRLGEAPSARHPFILPP